MIDPKEEDKPTMTYQNHVEADLRGTDENNQSSHICRKNNIQSQIGLNEVSISQTHPDSESNQQIGEEERITELNYQKKSSDR